MSDQINANEAEKKALEVLFKLTEEITEGDGGHNQQFIPAEVRLTAAMELLQYAERKSVSGATARPQPRQKRHRDE